MQVDPAAAADARVAAAIQRVDARDTAAAYAAQQSGLAHDQRVEEAKASDAARPTVAEQRARQPRFSSGSRILDVLA